MLQWLKQKLNLTWGSITMIAFYKWECVWEHLIYLCARLPLSGWKGAGLLHNWENAKWMTSLQLEVHTMLGEDGTNNMVMKNLVWRGKEPILHTYIWDINGYEIL